MIELDARSRELVAEVRELGREYMRPMGLESPTAPAFRRRPTTPST